MFLTSWAEEPLSAAQHLWEGSEKTLRETVLQTPRPEKEGKRYSRCWSRGSPAVLGGPTLQPMDIPEGYPFQPTQTPCWSRGIVQGDKNGREEMLWTDCSPPFLTLLLLHWWCGGARGVWSEFKPMAGGRPDIVLIFVLSLTTTQLVITFLF